MAEVRRWHQGEARVKQAGHLNKGFAADLCKVVSAWHPGCHDHDVLPIAELGSDSKPSSSRCHNGTAAAAMPPQPVPGIQQAIIDTAGPFFK